MFRYEIINGLIEKYNFKSYLEIGVRNPNDCFNQIDCDLKHGVDPGIEGDYEVEFKMTSDEFFSQNKIKYDIIFIDGLHIDAQVYRDIVNSLEFISDSGFILLHDCNPPSIYHCRENYGDINTIAGGHWNGTVWKALVHARSTIENIYTSVVDTDWGVGIIQKSDNTNKIINNNIFFSYEEFSKNREYYLNLISVDEFLSIYLDKKPDYRPSLTWLAKFDDYSSMGILSTKILEEISTRRISCQTIIGESTTKNTFIKKHILKENKYELGIMFSYPDLWSELSKYTTKVIYTGVDTTGGIASFAENCNKVDFLLTPSNISKKRMENLGITKPIFVFPHGVDTKIFKFSERKDNSIFKFLYIGECSDRKGIFSLLKAFVFLFSNNSNVELHIHSNSDMLFYGAKDVSDIIKNNKNIIWSVNNYDQEQIIKFYEECHVYVYPSRADTFGMTLIEAMVSGLPIISTNEPGSTELIKGLYYEVKTTSVPVKGHPWMLGEWGEVDITSLIEQMKYVFNNYSEIIKSGKLEEYSSYVVNNYTWSKLVGEFETNILPKLKKTKKIITLLTSFNRPEYIVDTITSLKKIKDNNTENTIYLVENSSQENKTEIFEKIKGIIDSNFIVYDSEFNLGQRGALLQMLDDIDIDDYDYIQFTDQDNIFNEPLITFCEILEENPDIFFVTGYMSKEHKELGWRKSRFGYLCEKRSLRAGHMFMRVSDLKSLFPIHLDSQYGLSHNSSWNAGLDWELSWWNKKSPGKLSEKNFVLCVPNAVIHIGMNSTMYNWDVKNNEYTTKELIYFRNRKTIF